MFLVHDVNNPEMEMTRWLLLVGVTKEECKDHANTWVTTSFHLLLS